jgi:hypothetical protein
MSKRISEELRLKLRESRPDVQKLLGGSSSGESAENAGNVASGEAPEICPLCAALGGGHVAGCARLAEEIPIGLEEESPYERGGLLRPKSEAPAPMPAQSKTFHLRIDLAGALSHWNPQEWRECVRDDDGIMLTPPRVREKFQEMLAAGTRFIPVGSCDDFDPQHGCRGHRSPAPAVDLPPVTVVAREGLNSKQRDALSGFFEHGVSTQEAIDRAVSAAPIQAEPKRGVYPRPGLTFYPNDEGSDAPARGEPANENAGPAIRGVGGVPLEELLRRPDHSHDAWDKFRGRLVTCDSDRTPHIFGDACNGLIHLSERSVNREFQIDDLAKGAYGAYGLSTNNKNFRGEEMPKWEELPEAIRSAWKAAVIFVFEKVA